MKLLCSLLAVVFGTQVPTIQEARVPIGEPIGIVEAAASAAPVAGLLLDLERRRVERSEAFVWLAPAAGEAAPEVLGYARRELVRIGPGEWRAQVREIWGADGLETHSVERLGRGSVRRLVERELRAPSGRTVYARWNSLAVGEPVQGDLRITTSGEGTPETRVVAPAVAGLPALGRPALVELLRRDLAPARCLALDPYSGRFEPARLVQVAGLPGFPGLRLALWISENPESAGELRRWWVFQADELLALGGAAGTAFALRTHEYRLPETF